MKAYSCTPHAHLPLKITELGDSVELDRLRGCRLAAGLHRLLWAASVRMSEPVSELLITPPSRVTLGAMRRCGGVPYERLDAAMRQMASCQSQLEGLAAALAPEEPLGLSVQEATVRLRPTFRSGGEPAIR